MTEDNDKPQPGWEKLPKEGIPTKQLNMLLRAIQNPESLVEHTRDDNYIYGVQKMPIYGTEKYNLTFIMKEFNQKYLEGLPSEEAMGKAKWFPCEKDGQIIMNIEGYPNPWLRALIGSENQ